MTGSQPKALPPTEAGLRPEARLLLACAAPGEPDAVRARIQPLLGAVFDWEWTLDCAIENRVVPALYLAMREGAEAYVPDPVRQRLAWEFHASTAHNVELFRLMTTLLQALASEGIEAIPYKGPMLAKALYGDLSHRQMWDLDLLVRPESLPHARRCLLRAGLQPVEPVPDDAGNLTRRWEENYRSPDGRLHVELQWRIMPRGYLDEFDDAWLWDQRIARQLNGYTLFTFTPEALLILLCLHNGLKHRWARLRWIADIAHFIRANPDTDWDAIDALARRWRIQSELMEALALAWTLLATPPPEPWRERVACDRRAMGLAAMARGRLFRGDRGLPSWREWTAYGREHASAIGMVDDAGVCGGRLLYLSLLAAPGTADRDLAAALTGGARGWRWLSWAIRPFRLFALHGLRLWRRIAQ